MFFIRVIILILIVVVIVVCLIVFNVSLGSMNQGLIVLSYIYSLSLIVILMGVGIFQLP